MVNTFIMSGNTSDFTTKYSPSIVLDPTKNMKQLSCRLIYTIPFQILQIKTTYSHMHRTVEKRGFTSL